MQGNREMRTKKKKPQKNQEKENISLKLPTKARAS